MSGLGQQKQEVISKIRAVTKIVNEQSSNPLDSFIDNTLGSFIDDGFKSFDKMSPKKLTDLQTKESLKKENKKAINYLESLKQSNGDWKSIDEKISQIQNGIIHIARH